MGIIFSEHRTGCSKQEGLLRRLRFPKTDPLSRKIQEYHDEYEIQGSDFEGSSKQSTSEFTRNSEKNKGQHKEANMNIAQMFSPSTVVMERVETLARYNENKNKVVNLASNQCTTCWGGWCANGITG